MVVRVRGVLHLRVTADLTFEITAVYDVATPPSKTLFELQGHRLLSHGERGWGKQQVESMVHM